MTESEYVRVHKNDLKKIINALDHLEQFTRVIVDDLPRGHQDELEHLCDNAREICRVFEQPDTPMIKELK